MFLCVIDEEDNMCILRNTKFDFKFIGRKLIKLFIGYGEEEERKRERAIKVCELLAKQ